MSDRNTSTRSEEHSLSTGPRHAGRNWSGTSLHDQYRAIGISAVAAAMRWPDPVPRKDRDTERNARELPPCLRDLD